MEGWHTARASAATNDTGKSIHWGKRDAQLDLEQADGRGWVDEE
jgi:hypothetical protein